MGSAAAPAASDSWPTAPRAQLSRRLLRTDGLSLQVLESGAPQTLGEAA